MGQVHPYASGGRAFAHDNIEGVVLHGRVQNLLHTAVHTVYFVYEQYVVFV